MQQTYLLIAEHVKLRFDKQWTSFLCISAKYSLSLKNTLIGNFLVGMLSKGLGIIYWVNMALLIMEQYVLKLSSNGIVLITASVGFQVKTTAMEVYAGWEPLKSNMRSPAVLKHWDLIEWCGKAWILIKCSFLILWVWPNLVVNAHTMWLIEKSSNFCTFSLC